MRGTALIALSFLVLGTLPAQAAPRAMSKDKTDNVMYVTYDAGTGELPERYSSARIKANDRVSWYVYIKENPGADQGERLRATMTLELIGDEPVVYDGCFQLIVRDDDGIAYSEERHARILLKPKKGERKDKLNFTFDLTDSGEYSSTGRFVLED